jgi:hypothetical protein
MAAFHSRVQCLLKKNSDRSKQNTKQCPHSRSIWVLSFCISSWDCGFQMKLCKHTDIYLLPHSQENGKQMPCWNCVKCHWCALGIKKGRMLPMMILPPLWLSMDPTMMDRTTTASGSCNLGRVASTTDRSGVWGHRDFQMSMEGLRGGRQQQFFWQQHGILFCLESSDCSNENLQRASRSGTWCRGRWHERWCGAGGGVYGWVGAEFYSREASWVYLVVKVAEE